MTGFLWQPWTWFAGAFALTFALIQLAARYLANRPLTDTDRQCSRDEILTRRAACQRPTLVAARLEGVQDLALEYGAEISPRERYEQYWQEWLAAQEDAS